MPENLQPPRAASRILSWFGGPHLPQILGDLMEEFNERTQSAGLLAARRWYWRATFRNMFALAARGELMGKLRPRTLFLISSVWFGIALLWTWLWHGWFTRIEHQGWGIVTVAVCLAYFLLVMGWLAPLLLALIRLASPSRMQGKHVR